ncbi:MAG TPA: cupin-like domain-containing protein, partial [Bryobacteraceae bacterium]|nr:cupin-like domain-containing protein [Bryobacteraceae bacterium]
EHNFLCQVQGTKQVSIWDPRDRTVLPEPQIEHMLQIWHGDDYHRNMPFKQEFQERAREYTLNPGDALHFPVGAPHWVKNGNQVSISFSITFRSRYSERQAIIYFLNGKVRRLGLRPTPPGVSGWRDGLKVAAFQTVRFAARVGGGSWLKRNQSKWA